MPPDRYVPRMSKLNRPVCRIQCDVSVVVLRRRLRVVRDLVYDTPVAIESSWGGVVTLKLY